MIEEKDDLVNIPGCPHKPRAHICLSCYKKVLIIERNRVSAAKEICHTKEGVIAYQMNRANKLQEELKELRLLDSLKTKEQIMKYAFAEFSKRENAEYERGFNHGEHMQIQKNLENLDRAEKMLHETEELAEKRFATYEETIKNLQTELLTRWHGTTAIINKGIMKPQDFHEYMALKETIKTIMEFLQMLKDEDVLPMAFSMPYKNSHKEVRDWLEEVLAFNQK